jgi:SAM-dependent methyltransferase
LRKQDGPFLFEIRLRTQEPSSREAYNSIYDEGGLSQLESFYLWIVRHMQLPAQGRLLDVSSGAGEVVRLTASRNLNAIGIDISESAARSAHQNLQSDPHLQQRTAFCVSSGEALPFPDGFFDVVTNIGSLEHFLDPAQGVREMARVLSPVGKAYIFVPNTFSLLINVWEAFRFGRTSVDNQSIQRYGARLDWTILLEENGLRVIKTIKFERSWPYHTPDWPHYIRHPRELIRLAVAPLVPLNLSFCFFFFCERI